MGTNGSNSADSSAVRAGIAISVSVSFAIALVWLCCHFSRSVKKEDDRRRSAGSVPTAGIALSMRQQPPPPAVPPVELPAGAPLLCTYCRSDGWREATWPVCLSDVADGETVRVLPACMHHFHAACVGEWLRSKTTCPVCRAVPPAAAEVLDAVV